MSQQQPNDQEIRKMLIQLHDELQRTQTLDEDEKAMMRHLMADIQTLLNPSGGSGAGDSGAQIYPANTSVLDRFEQSIDVLEAEHPTLASMIRKALDTLNIAGI